MNYVELATGTSNPSIEQATRALLKVREMKNKINKKLKTLEEGEEALEAYILRVMANQHLDKVVTCGVQLAPMTRLVPQATDWTQIYDWIRHSGDLTILHRRLSSERLKVLAEQDDLPPGVQMVELVRLSVRTVRRNVEESA